MKHLVLLLTMILLVKLLAPPAQAEQITLDHGQLPYLQLCADTAAQKIYERIQLINQKYPRINKQSKVNKFHYITRVHGSIISPKADHLILNIIGKKSLVMAQLTYFEEKMKVEEQAQRRISKVLYKSHKSAESTFLQKCNNQYQQVAKNCDHLKNQKNFQAYAHCSQNHIQRFLASLR